MAFRLLRPILRRLSRRDTVLFGCRLRAAPGVFSPGLYFSTRLLARYILRLSLSDRTFLDMGTGSGALGILAAKQGARVLAVDVNPAAVALARSNAALNSVADRVEVVVSDLFTAVSKGQRFDYIVFNPPFYAQTPMNDEERAWFAGEGYQTIRDFFRDVGRSLQPAGHVIVIYSTNMDLDEMAHIAEVSGFILVREIVIPHLFERFLIREYRGHGSGIKDQGMEDGLADPRPPTPDPRL